MALTSSIKKHGFAVVPTAVLTDPSLSAGAKAEYAVISGYRGDRDVAWPSTKKIGEALKRCRNTVYSYRKELEEAGLISFHVIRGRFDDGKFGTRTYYTFTDDVYASRRGLLREEEDGPAEEPPEWAEAPGEDPSEEARRCLAALSAASVKPIERREEGRALKSVRRLLDDGASADTIIRAYAAYVERCNADSPETTRYVKRLTQWLTAADGAAWDILTISRTYPMPASTRAARRARPPVAEEPAGPAHPDLGPRYDELAGIWDEAVPEMMCKHILGPAEEAQARALALTPIHEEMAEIERKAEADDGQAARSRQESLQRVLGGAKVA